MREVCVVVLFCGACVKNASFGQSGGELFTSNLINATAETEERRSGRVSYDQRDDVGKENPGGRRGVGIGGIADNIVTSGHKVVGEDDWGKGNSVRALYLSVMMCGEVELLKLPS